MRSEQLKVLFRTVLLGSCLCILTSCAAWKSNHNQDSAAVIDGNSPAAQTAGLGDESEDQGSTVASRDQDLTKRTYYFDFDKSDIRDEDRPAIEANANYLQSHPSAKTLLEGHTDPRGSREYNIALGERRAKAIEAVMKEKGVNSSQVRLISYGAEKLASNGHNEEDYQQDRRGVLVYLQQ